MKFISQNTTNHFKSQLSYYNFVKNSTFTTPSSLNFGNIHIKIQILYTLNIYNLCINVIFDKHDRIKNILHNLVTIPLTSIHLRIMNFHHHKQPIYILKSDSKKNKIRKRPLILKFG